VTAFVETPPLLLNTTLLVNALADPGAKLTVTVPVCPGPTAYGLPLVTVNGDGAEAVPASVTSPVLITENGSVLVKPIVTDPKSRLTGLTTNSGGRTTTIKLARVLVLVPTGPLTINCTVFVPAAA
jgi:hypothetical protein